MKKYHGILIFGANGCGKTTVGKELSKILCFKHIDHEDYAFKESEMPYSIQRSNDECIALMLSDIKKHGSFVLSAVTGDFGDEIISMIDLAVLLQAPDDIRVKRVERRSYEKYGERVLAGGDMYETDREFINFVSTRSTGKIEKWAETLKCPVIRVDGRVDCKVNADNRANLYKDITQQNVQPSRLQ